GEPDAPRQASDDIPKEKSKRCHPRGTGGRGHHRAQKCRRASEKNRRTSAPMNPSAHPRPLSRKTALQETSSEMPADRKADEVTDDRSRTRRRRGSRQGNGPSRGENAAENDRDLTGNHEPEEKRGFRGSQHEDHRERPGGRHAKEDLYEMRHRVPGRAPPF